MEVRAIVAVSPDGIIGAKGGIPWKKSQDLKRFKAQTMGGTLIMGRKTWWSIGRRKLPGRETIVISRTPQEGVNTCDSIEAALKMAETFGAPVWIAGGSDVYELALPHIQEFDLTVILDANEAAIKSYEDFGPTTLSELAESRTVFKPFLDGMPGFKLVSEEVNAEDPTLLHRRYVRP